MEKASVKPRSLRERARDMHQKDMDQVQRVREYANTVVLLERDVNAIAHEVSDRVLALGYKEIARGEAFETNISFASLKSANAYEAIIQILRDQINRLPEGAKAEAENMLDERVEREDNRFRSSCWLEGVSYIYTTRDYAGFDIKIV